jgi:hypothetical protein
MDRYCPFCGDVMTCWARGRYALQLCLGAGAPDGRREVWRGIRRAGSWRCSGLRQNRTAWGLRCQ